MMRRKYIHKLPAWPYLTWRHDELAEKLAEVRFSQGRLVGRMEALGLQVEQETNLAALTSDVLKSSEIEGEILNPEQVRSSVAKHLDIDTGGVSLPTSQSIEGIVTVMLDATQNYGHSLTNERLFGWHSALFPSGRSEGFEITVGRYRTRAMQVVSRKQIGGPEIVHFEAPAAERVDVEMQTFEDWFNAPPDSDPVLKAGLAHLWFVTIHPFDDGNGRIARAIADMALARSENSPKRFYSMSMQIMRERDAYYQTLERTQAATTDVTAWLEWFLGCLNRAIASSESSISDILSRTRFWDHIAPLAINERQSKVLNLLLGDFEGNLTTTKWAKLTKCSHDTALRDITALMDHGILARGPEGGRSTNYVLVNDR